VLEAYAVDLQNRYTLITGASSGLGREMARVIARRHGGHLVIAARRRERLDELTRELRDETGVDVVPIAADLTVPSDVDALFEQATSQRTIDAVVLNAGVTYFGRAEEQPLDGVATMIATNVASVARLATRFAEHFVANRQKAHLLFVSSMASLAPMPYQALYGGTKAFLTNYAQALRHELGRHGIKVGVFLPGGIVTEMTELSGLSRLYKSGDVGMMEAPACARYAVDALRRGSAATIPGPTNHLLATAMRSFPKGLVLPVVERLYRGALTPAK
jgi:short-subunit dehydrogenase